MRQKPKREVEKKFLFFFFFFRMREIAVGLSAGGSGREEFAEGVLE